MREAFVPVRYLFTHEVGLPHFDQKLTCEDWPAGRPEIRAPLA